jgi:hypothetical protein
VPFAQFSIGSLSNRISVDEERFDVTASQTDLTLQLGGGLNLNMTDRFSIRGIVAYLPVFSERETQDLIRFVAGVVTPFGRR